MSKTFKVVLQLVVSKVICLNTQKFRHEFSINYFRSPRS